MHPAAAIAPARRPATPPDLRCPRDADPRGIATGRPSGVPPPCDERGPVHRRPTRADRTSNGRLPPVALAGPDSRGAPRAWCAASPGHLDRPRLGSPVRRVRPVELEMARELKRWLAAALAAWGVIVIGYVPPRGVAPVATARPRPPQPTAARLRAQALAEAWRDADLALRLARYRRQLEPELARRREADQAGPAVVVEAPDSLAAYAGEVVRSALDTVWRELGLGVSKVGVGVVVDFWRTRPAGTGQTPKVVAGSASHLLPDSTDRTTCVALIPAWYRTATLRTSSGPGRRQQVEDWLQAGLGPCAFLAAWGVPGSDVRRWLARRSYDLAAFPSWDRDWSMQSQSQWMSVRFATDAKAAPTWWWPAVYGHPIAAIGCLAGRAASCRTAVLSDSVPRVEIGRAHV